ncbi:MAG: hypothetical protein K9N48_05090 [Verrucomicrobia bacterium]|nr:hypothetical protein [Verrucomicrobiota bacterium]MCF7707926.1 hypothetical protein [Verrucomicrobiota bacterium]
MRVTSNTLPDMMGMQLNRLAAKQYDLQEQAATGRKLRELKDDPSAALRVLEMQHESRKISRYGENIALLKEQATVSFQSLRSIQQIIDRASELATMTDGTRSESELEAFRQEVTQLIEEGVQVLNAEHRGSYLFGGTITDSPPFSLVKNPDTGLVTEVDYSGNSDVSEAEIDNGVTVTSLVPGENSTGSGRRGVVYDTRTGADIFGHLIDLQNHLDAGDYESVVSTDAANIRKDEDNILFHVASNGVFQSKLETAGAASKSRSETVTQMISKDADADLAQVLVKFNQAQNAYQAALQTSSRLMGLSLFDYLR